MSLQVGVGDTRPPWLRHCLGPFGVLWVQMVDTINCVEKKKLLREIKLIPLHKIND